MHSIRFRFSCALVVLLLAMLACNAPLPASQNQPTATVFAPALGATQPVTATEALVLTPTETLTPEPSLTATTGVPVGQVVKETNCRTGPGSQYDLVVTFQAGANVEIVARDLGGGYVFVKDPTQPEKLCWLLESNITVSGDITPLPAYTPLPSPTAAPDFTVTFKNYDTCSGDPFVRFVIVNTGNFAFRSAYVKVTIIQKNVSTEITFNAFDLTVGCVIAQNIAPLKPGGTGYLQSDRFSKDPKGQKLHAIFMLCTDQNLKGACITKTLDFKK